LFNKKSGTAEAQAFVSLAGDEGFFHDTFLEGVVIPMQPFKQKIAAQISALLDGRMTAQEIYALLEYPPDPAMGDLSLPCFRLSKLLRQAPQAIAEQFMKELSDAVIERTESVSGYFNIFLNKRVMAESIVNAILREQDRYGAQTIGEGKTVVIDFSSPNIAKPFHVGHLRSTVIGRALYRIFSFLGYHCVGINHLGDWGTQFGKLIAAYRLWGDPAKLEQNGIDELLRLYVRFHEEAEKDPALEEQARAWFAKMEQGDEEALRLWKQFVEISLNEFQIIYDLLGVQFDSIAGESFYNDKIAAVVEELKQKQLLEEDQGAWLVRLDAYDMAPALILKQDGSSLYHTRDLAAAIYRKKTYDFDKAIYVTDYAQNLHFQQWFKIIELMGYEWAKDLVHVPFGRVSLEGMSLSTRKGNVVKLEDVLKESIQKTLAIIEAKNPDLPNKQKVAEQVGVGAVIFNDLSANRIKDIVFSWEDALNFDGETGPYVQYTHARACSLLRKANGSETIGLDLGDRGFDPALLLDAEALGVLKELSLFPERIVQSMEKLEPSVISRYLIDLAQQFNRFYHAHPILVEDTALRTARLTLVKCVQITLRNGMRLIGLESPEAI
jgi:arginyl-tRNA synthetase